MPSPSPTDSPWALTLDRLAELDPYWAAEIGTPVGEHWFRLDQIAGGPAIVGWVDELAAEHGGQRDVAASYLSGWLAGIAVGIPVAAYVLDRRLPDPADLGGWWGRRHPEGWFDRIAFGSSRVVVGPGDPAAGHADSTTLDEAEALERYAVELVDVLAPVLGRIRNLAAFGLSGLWGMVADEITSSALWAARVAGQDPDDAWRIASTLTDAVAARSQWLRARPQPFTVDGPDGRELFQVRGTCCLYYKTQAQPVDADADADGYGYCTTCPRRDDDTRHDRLVAFLSSPETEI